MAHHPSGDLSGIWDIPRSLRCAARPHPSFGSRPKARGKWYDRGSNLYDLEFTIRAGGNGATAGSGVWMIGLPLLDGYRLWVTPPDWDEPADSGPVNSYMVGFAQVATNMIHLGTFSVHTLSSRRREASDESKLVIARTGSLFVGGPGWVPGNVHFATHRPFPGRWVAET